MKTFKRAEDVPLYGQEMHAQVRRAEQADAALIFNLIESLSGDGTLLHRSLAEIEASLSTFIVASTEQGEFLGCAALHRYGQHLAEVRSIAVRPEARGAGAGGMLLQWLVAEMALSGTRCACLFTRVPTFFAHYGFKVVNLSAVPDKFNKDCILCPRRNACDEIAMAMGELPGGFLTGAIPASALVSLPSAI